MNDIEKLKRAVELLQDFCARQQVQLQIIHHKLAELQNTKNEVKTDEQ